MSRSRRYKYTTLPVAGDRPLRRINGDYCSRSQTLPCPYYSQAGTHCELYDDLLETDGQRPIRSESCVTDTTGRNA